jgi:single-stranded-DNA-specific exonuclease
MWTSPTGRRWELRPADDRRVDELSTGLRVLPVTARVLAARGFDVASARSFLDPAGLRQHDPALLLGLAPALERIERAIAKGEHIRLVTDYDTDGTTSCLILHAALDRRIARADAKARVTYHIPDRFLEGYGLSVRAAEQAAADGVGLLITADIGVRDHASVRRATELGVDVIVCDHHLPAGEEVPAAALAVICPPQRGCPYPNKALAACGVSLKLSTALLAEDPRKDEVIRSLIKLAAIGTVADVVDLSTSENRAIVALGLAALNADRHGAGLSALLDVAGLDPRKKPIDATDLGFRVGPRINAAGRLKDANAVVRLLRERDATAARTQAHALDALNRERQSVQEHLTEQAMARVPSPVPGFVVVWGPEAEGWHRGVVGIVASKVRDRVHRPTAVVAVLGASATGSIRSIPAIHAVRALDSVADLFHRYGGHAAAAGFSLATDRLPELAERLSAFVDAHSGDDALVPRAEADALVGGDRVGPGLVAELGRLEPCGKGNPAATLAITGRIDGVRVIRDKHLFFRVGGASAVWWSGAEHREEVEAARVVFGSAGFDGWNGRSEVRITVEDVAAGGAIS